jgi:membrane protein YqaA with SNARE-associated domain
VLSVAPRPARSLGPAEEGSVTLWSMYKSVALPAFLWGAGTAIGELPPYLFARAARLAGRRLAELREVDEEARSSGSLTLLERAKVWIYEGLQRYGMVVIVLCASVPNPAFDMAGITCGHFLVPVWSFFLATFLGKAVIKANLQTWFMILVFGSDLVDNLALWVRRARRAD